MIHTASSYDFEDRLTGETVSTDSGPDGLAAGFMLPTAYNPAGFEGRGMAGSVAMLWDGHNAFLSPQMTEALIGTGNGEALVSPQAGIAYGGNGSDWVMMSSDQDGDLDVEIFTLSDGVFTPDGVVTALDSGNPAAPFTIDPSADGYR